VHLRLQLVLESTEHVDHEQQCGFRTGRGTCDASFTVKQATKKRREHGLETWWLFLDLVKAFDRVPRDAKKKPPMALGSHSADAQATQAAAAADPGVLDPMVR